MTRERITVVGAGPVGSLLAIFLARQGYSVALYEGRPDSRKTSIYQGKSINIALSDRGWRSLEKIGIATTAKEQALPMSRRTIHGMDGELTDIPYGLEGNAIWSVSRLGINEQLLGIAEQEENVTVYFEHRLVDIDFDAATTTFKVCGEEELVVTADIVFGADGARSKVRRLAQELPRFSYSQNYMPQSYIELNIPPDASGAHKIEKNALHIWPRKDFMMIALPNPDGSFTGTLFLDHDGDLSFASLQNPADIAAFFEEYFADAVHLIEDPVETFVNRSPSPLFLVQVFPWCLGGKVGLIGDAAHAIVPFYGQGMNSGFEDCTELDRLITEYDHDWSKIFSAYESARKPNADAIAELSKRNFVEMSDLSGDPRFQLQKKIEAKFSQLFPDLWTPLYSMVTFSPDIPYAEALRMGDLQNGVMNQVMALPNIEDNWDEAFVMDNLFALASAALGNQE